LVSPSYKRIFLKKARSKSMIHEVLTCQHCIDHPCYDACPLQETAMCIDEDGVVYIDELNCIGCGLCAKACVLTPSRINLVKHKDRSLRKARKCDLCRGRAEGPACIELCPWICIGMSDEPVPDLPIAGTAAHTMNIAKESVASTNETTG
jgi:Fe-S-cluster-containing dehydrogenase component